MSATLANKIALVTGADGGLGVHVTRALLDSGATVIGISRHQAQTQFTSPAFTAITADLSKAALVSLIRTAALENKDAGITANVILPGTMDTPANRTAMPNADFSKWVSPANVASLLVWLASDPGKDVNGAAIPMYGAEL